MSERLQTRKCSSVIACPVIPKYNGLLNKNLEPTKLPLVQFKLAINQPGDEYEKEADSVAEQVLSMQDPVPQRKCAKCNEEKVLQTKETLGEISQDQNQDSSPLVHEVLQSHGEPLDFATRAFMEPRFGHNFSKVRVYSDASAAQSAHDLNALAYTVGHNMVFAKNRFEPSTQEGRQLIAHELTHVLQQSGDKEISLWKGDKNDKKSDFSFKSDREGKMLRPSVPSALQVARQAVPNREEECSKEVCKCSGEKEDPCKLTNCSPAQQKTAVADLGRGLGYVNSSVKALAAMPLSGFTSRALEWYFGGQDTVTVSTISTRLSCIATSLSSAPGRYGCNPKDDALAYTCAGGAGFCGHLNKDICFTDKHFNRNSRERAIVAIHEASHLEGMSTGTPSTNPDIYENEMRFLDMSPSQAVQNADSYALFAAAIGTNDLPSMKLLTLGAAGGLALSALADPTWYFQGTLGLELQHPRLRVFNPTLQLGLTLIGEAENKEASIRASQSTLISVLGGFRIGKARRPGTGSGLEMSLFGGPSLSVAGLSTGLGAVAGVAFGYRWRMVDVSVGTGYAYDPLRSQAGLEHTVTVGGTFTINLFH